MDGTLTVSNIDYALMRALIDVPEGDLFTVMEGWSSGQRICEFGRVLGPPVEAENVLETNQPTNQPTTPPAADAMDAILAIEATAAADVQPMDGLEELLSLLAAHPGTRAGIVTRNTPAAVDAFFARIGEEKRALFDIVLTREHPHVKPDKRALTHFCDAWGLEPHTLLMVGDSTEDIETGNAAGTATCFVAGGGNEVGGGPPPPPPPGAVPTFAVGGLAELAARLAARDTGLGWGAYAPVDGLPSSSSSDFSDSDDGAAAPRGYVSDGSEPGAPAPGLPFLDFLFASGAVAPAACSFPRLDGARRGVPLDAHPGSKVLHLLCGDGALTKLLFASGLYVVGADAAPLAARAAKRGLRAVALAALDAPGALAEAATDVGAFDAVVAYGAQPGAAGPLEARLWSAGALGAARGALRAGGALALEAEAPGGAAGAAAAVEAAGFAVAAARELAPRGGGAARVRVVAYKAGE
jgi:HAD superfamily hydrolase (TIGR01509 family)